MLVLSQRALEPLHRHHEGDGSSSCLSLSGSVAVAGHSEVLDHLQAKQLAAAEKAQNTRVEAATAGGPVAEATARAAMHTNTHDRRLHPHHAEGVERLERDVVGEEFSKVQSAANEPGRPQPHRTGHQNRFCVRGLTTP